MKIRQISFRLFVWLQIVLFCVEKLKPFKPRPCACSFENHGFLVLACLRSAAHVSARRLFWVERRGKGFLGAHAVEVPLVWEARMCAGTGL